MTRSAPVRGQQAKIELPVRASKRPGELPAVGRPHAPGDDLIVEAEPARDVALDIEHVQRVVRTERQSPATGREAWTQEVELFEAVLEPGRRLFEYAYRSVG